MHEISKRIYDLLGSSNEYNQSKLANYIGVDRSTVNKWFKDPREPKPSYENVESAAEYFGTSTKYLWDGEEKKWEPAINAKDEKDIQKKLDNILNQLDNDTGLMFDGEVVDDETKEKLRISLEMVMRGARKEAKEKFTPKKYKK